MSWRGVSVVLLCEDRQQAAFARRFLETAGVLPRRIRQVPLPSGAGAAEQFVREQFPVELEAHRRLTTRTLLVAIIDADTGEIEQRRRELDRECELQEVRPRRPDEAVAILVPRRNIETWLTWLHGKDVDEHTAYTKLRREKDCKPMVLRLSEFCKAGALPGEPPPSLADACHEWNTRCRPVLE